VASAGGVGNKLPPLQRLGDELANGGRATYHGLLLKAESINGGERPREAP
jgi:hypothetical protein